MILDNKGILFIQNEEGCRLNAYQDKGGVWTIGYGNTYYLDGTPVKGGDTILQSGANALFEKLTPIYESTVNTIPNLLQNQFNACTSLCWNIGHEAFTTSSLYKKLISDPNSPDRINTVDMTDIHVQQQIKIKELDSIHLITYYFLLWHNDAGMFDIDLFNRRWREALMYFNQD